LIGKMIATKGILLPLGKMEILADLEIAAAGAAIPPP
jgi:hypothetical protein